MSETAVYKWLRKYAGKTFLHDSSHSSWKWDVYSMYLWLSTACDVHVCPHTDFSWFPYCVWECKWISSINIDVLIRCLRFHLHFRSSMILEYMLCNCGHTTVPLDVEMCFVSSLLSLFRILQFPVQQILYYRWISSEWGGVSLAPKVAVQQW